MMLTLFTKFHRLGGGRTSTQALQIVQFGHQVLHQIVFSESPLVEHLTE